MKESSLRYYPLAFFSSVMGFAAVTIATRQLELTYEVPHFVSCTLFIITALWFLFNLVVFGFRSIQFPKEVKHQFSHPIQMNFFAAISISFLLMAVLFLPYSTTAAFTLWIIGAVMQFSLTIIFLHNIIWSDSFAFMHFTPLSFLPIVGNLVVPIAGSELAPIQLNWFFFGFGITFSIIYLTFMFNRLFFRKQLPGKMLPTIFIIMAPPAVAFVAYINITNSLDVFANILYGVALFFGFILLMQLPKIFSLQFAVTFLAQLFSFAALIFATLSFYRETSYVIYSIINIVQIVGLFAFLLYFSWKTFQAARRKKLCQPEG